MRATRRQIAEANRIAARFGGWREPEEIRAMYEALDYRVRGFTRDVSGKKLFIDHDITSIQDYIDAKILARYDAIDINVYQANLFHTNMLIKELDLQNYLFNVDANELPPQTRLDISSSLRREMIEIFSGRNIY